MSCTGGAKPTTGTQHRDGGGRNGGRDERPALSDVVTKWCRLRDQFARIPAQLDGVAVCDAVLADLEHLARADADEVLTLDEAAARSGYSPSHLGRLVRQGTIPNAGRAHAPRIRARDLPPRKPGGLRQTETNATLGGPKRRVAAAVLRS